MDIRSATEQIEGAVRAYLAKDKNGLPLVPERMQRPIILMGPPGIGKTAIVSQVAEHLGINFVSYSITHHTRQSALGLPYIADASFGGEGVRVSRYTMSEIIAAAYDAMERTGVSEGILFLDEVNCASETLAPAMLQFLQYKTFGQHKLPKGWVIVCAGNPPEYNRAARDFDPAMLDRMKRIDIEPNLDVWMDYATTHGVHPAITTYLQNKPDQFYLVRAGVKGSRIVTARGWEDLSRMLIAYRHEGLKVDLGLIEQYLQDKTTAEDFCLYLELFSRYEDDYKVGAILDGTAGASITERAAAAPLDEKIALVNMLLAALLQELHEADARERAQASLEADLGVLLDENGVSADSLAALAKEDDPQLSEHAQLERAAKNALVERLRTCVQRAGLEGVNPRAAAQEELERAASELGHDANALAGRLDNALTFLAGAFGDGNEMLVFTTHLAVDAGAMRFLAGHPSHKFIEHSRALMLHERGSDLLKIADELA